jgi:VWFA-related protein
MAPVVVRDGSGNAVNTLGREDFELFDRGKRREIARFSVESEENTSGSPAGSPDPPPAAPMRFLAILFDDANLSPEDMPRVRKAAQTVVAGLRPEDRAAVYTTTNAVQAGFTADLVALRQATDKLAGQHALPATDPKVSYFLAGQILNRNDRAALEMPMRQIKRVQPGTPDHML